MTSFMRKLKNLFAGSTSGHGAVEGKAVDFKGLRIVPTPFKDGNQWRIAGRIESPDENDRRAHHFIRSDVFHNREDAERFTIRKGELIISQSGERILDDPGNKPAGS